MTAALSPNSSLRKTSYHISIIAAGYAMFGGLLSFLGWAAGVTQLTDWAGTGIAIKANTAVAIVFAASALFCAVAYPSAQRLGRVLALLTLTIGGLTLFEHLTEFNLGIDTLLFDEAAGAPATAAPGRMGPPAAFSFLALGTAILLRIGNPRGHAWGMGLAIAVLGICSLSLIGYAYGARVMYMIPRLTGIAVQSATMLVALSIGVIAAHSEREPMKTLWEDSSTSGLARRMIATAFIVPVGLGWLRIQGFRSGLYDNEFGTALRTVVEIAILIGMLWWSLQAIRARETLQRRAEAERHLSEQRLVHTLESMTDGFVTLDSDWRFTYVNAEAERIVHRARTDLIGYGLWDLFPQIVDTPLHAKFLRAARERITLEIESDDFVAGGERHFRNRIYPAADGGLSVYLQDVTTRKNAEVALREAARRKDEFLATLAHELRNPLAPIRNAAAVLRRENVPAPIALASAEIINRQVQHMARLLEDLLDISRISRHRLELRKEAVEVAQIIHSAIETSRPAIEKAGHALAVELPTETIYLNGDPIRLAQVLSNLLNNAAQYTEHGGRISIAAQCDATTITIQIADNGVGIDAQMLPHIFEMFTQAAPTAPGSTSGLGIGLSLARGIIELHGGTIDAFSAGVGAGSQFSIHLPRLQSVAAPTPITERPALATEKRRVLVVDDLKDSADTLAMVLKYIGHEVQVAYSGQGALDIAAAFLPQIIFMDIGMPELDGLETCKQIRQTPWGRNIFIVALTGWGHTEDLRRTDEAGFNAHLLKPADIDALLRLLTTATVPDNDEPSSPSTL